MLFHHLLYKSVQKTKQKVFVRRTYTSQWKQGVSVVPVPPKSTLQSLPPTVQVRVGRSSDAQYRASNSTDALVMLPQPLTSKIVSWQQCCNRFSIAVKITRGKIVHNYCSTLLEIFIRRQPVRPKAESIESISLNYLNEHLLSQWTLNN